MQKKYLGSAILLLTVAILISGCKLKPSQQTGTVNNGTNNQNQEQNQLQASSKGTEIVNPTGEYTITELLTMNKPLKCTWKESATGDKDVTNIIYINGKKFYQDVTMGDLGHGYTISDGEYLYIWNDFTGAASKMKYSEIKISPVPGQQQAQGNAGLEQKRDFVCEKWTVDESVFIPPKDKNFKDVTEEMGQAVQDIQGNSGENKQQICDMCQKAPTQELIDKCLTNAQCE